ncbi:Tyrosine recombinase XerC [subsurface metagenome]
MSEGKSMDLWLDDLRSLSSSTKRSYLRSFKAFIERYETTPDKLYEMRLEDFKSEDPRDRLRIERMVKTYMVELHESGKSASTCRQVSKALSNFFVSQSLPLTMKAKDHPQGMSNGQKLALSEDIRLMWDHASAEFKLRNRAALVFLKDSGLRISDVNALNVGQWIEAETITRNGESFKVFEGIETKKTKVPAYPIVGPETVAAVNDYLEERRGQGKPMDPGSPLFINREKGRFNSDGFGQIFIYLGKKTGKNISAHSLRKFHTTMLSSIISEQYIKILQGRALKGSMGVYNLPQETGELLAAYVKAYPKLRIFGEQVSAQKIDEQAEKIKDLEAELAEERQKRIDMDSRIREIDEKQRQAEEILRELKAMKVKQE